MQYVAVIFDVIDSRRYVERYDVQNIMMNTIEYLNRLYDYAIKKNVVVSAGDEFQGLFKDLKTAFAYIRKLQLLIYPIRIRCGVGYGGIKYDVARWTSTAYDGDSYYLARDAISMIEKKKNNAICFNTGSRYDKYLNEFCSSDMQIKSRQSQIAHLIELVADIMLPIVLCTEDKNFYGFILESRYRFMEKENRNEVSRRFRDMRLLDLDLDYLFEIKAEFRPLYDMEDVFYMDEYWLRGMSAKIARVMNTSRQNIDRYISLERIKESRTMDKAIYELLGENIW